MREANGRIQVCGVLFGLLLFPLACTSGGSNTGGNGGSGSGGDNDNDHVGAGGGAGNDLSNGGGTGGQVLNGDASVNTDAASPLADTGMAADALTIPTNAKVWTGLGSTKLWATAENWSGGTVPGPDDDVVLDGTSTKECHINALIVVRSLTVTPDYKGILRIQSAGTVKGNLILSGRVTASFNAHTSFDIMGPIVDLSRVTQFGAGYATGNLALKGKSIVQSFFPPVNRNVVVPELWAVDGGTIKLEGPLNTIALYIESSGFFDVNGMNVTTNLLGVAGPMTNIGGVTFTVNGFANYTTNALGFSYHSREGVHLNLAPDKPWHLVLHQTKALYGAAPKPFQIVNADVGNLDVTGDSVVTKNCVDKGGNSGITIP